MADNLKKLPYRKNVAAIVMKGRMYLLLQRIDWEDIYWKFPQGGVDKGETDIVAINRELYEELGTNKFKIIRKSKIVNKYDWDPQSVKLAGNRWRGQIQSFFVVEFVGADREIKLSEEIKNYKWIDENELKKHINHKTMNYFNYYNSILKVLREAY